MALELVGGAVLSAFLEAALDRLSSPDVWDYFRGKRLDDKLLHELNVSLLSINAVIDDAEDKHISNKHVSAWLDMVKDVVLDAEDLFDEIHTEASKSKVEAEFQTATSEVLCCIPALVSSFDKKLQLRMKDILDKLETLASKKDILGLKEGTGVGVAQRLPTTSLVDEATVCGRDDDKKVIIGLLLSHNDNGSSGNNVSLISIVGMGGMGKTTLAQLVYNDSMVKDEFKLKAWVCVSEEFDIVRVTRTILEALTLSNDDTEDLNMLQVKLKEKLTGEKFLLVLDDVWDENYMKWEALQAPFVYGARGSKILVTTRSEKVASTMRCAYIHQLKQLPKEHSWLLFAKYALRDANSTSEFEEIGRKIIKKCNGLPLALKAIGSLLYTKLSYEEWNRILTSEMWDISDDEHGIILPALRLSYQYLPSSLKRCFAYCSLIPKDYEFDKDYLVELWMSENFLLVHQQNISMKELGDQVFNVLLLRSFFQRSSRAAELFVMHDLVNDLATYVSRGFCLRLEKEEAKKVSKMTRHISYLGNSSECSKPFAAFYKASKLRTFLPFVYQSMSTEMIKDLLCKFKCLRVLSLCSFFFLRELPNSIGNLKHLRYLDLSDSGVKRLPNSTCLLYNLQTLKLRDCNYLEKLPSDMHKLVNLRHLDFRGTAVRKMPNGMGNLKKLEVLSSFFVGKCDEFKINQLAGLKLQGTLSIEELQNVADPMDALAANLKSKIHLEGLGLAWCMNNGGFENERGVLEKLQPPTNLKQLCIQNYGGARFPDWFGDNYLSNMVFLELVDCKYCFSLPPLGILPSLKKLWIVGLERIEAIGPEFYGNDSFTAPFGCLQFLSFKGINGWEEWDCQNALGAFPSLKAFHITDCYRLKNQLPQHLPSLLKLEIRNCLQLVASLPCAPAIHELVLSDCGNLQWESLASTLRTLCIGGRCMERSFLEKTMYTISNTCLETLEFWDCPSVEFPICHPLNFLNKLVLHTSCDTLKALPLDLFPKLQKLDLEHCSNLERFSISDSLGRRSVSSLTELTVYRCPKFISFPEGMNTLFPSLTNMSLMSCPQLEWPDGGLPSSLETLSIIDCPKLVAPHRNWDLHNCTSLSRLHIVDENENGDTLDYKGLLPPNLKTLDYNACRLCDLSYFGYCPVLRPKGGFFTFSGC